MFQFAVSTALLAATLVAVAQLGHLRGQDDGFDRERVLDVNASEAGLWDARGALLKDAVAALPGVEAAAWTQAPPGLEGWTGQLVFPEGGSEDDVQTMETVVADADYAEALGLRVVAGRDLDADRATDAETGVLLNESGARALGWTPEEAVGEGARDVGAARRARSSASWPTTGTTGRAWPSGPRSCSRRGRAGGSSSAPRRASRSPRSASASGPSGRPGSRSTPSTPPRSTPSTTRSTRPRSGWRGRSGCSPRSAVVVACLGLFGLTAHAVAARTKEIGVRKVLGATVAGLVARLSRDVAVPVVVGLAVAAPLTWWALGRWLDGFAERVALTPLPFLAAGLGALALALLTAGVHTVRAATADPVRALRSE